MVKTRSNPHAADNPNGEWTIRERRDEMGIQAMTAAAAELANWYASHPLVRRLWAVEEIEAIRVVVTLEPTADDDDTQPAWLANSWTWAQDLRLRMNRVVHLEMINQPSHIEAMLDRHSALVTELSWRDPTIAPD